MFLLEVPNLAAPKIHTYVCTYSYYVSLLLTAKVNASKVLQSSASFP